MPGASKFTIDGQERFLEQHIDEYNYYRGTKEGRNKGGKKKFLADFDVKFLAIWPEPIPDDWAPIVEPPLPIRSEKDKDRPPPPTAEEQRETYQRNLNKTRSNQIANWFNNHTGSRAPDITNAGKVSKAVLTRAVIGGVQKRRISKKQAHHAYLQMNRETVQPIINREWAAMLVADNTLTHGQFVAFQNRRLKDMLAAESQEVRARVEVFRDEDLKRRLEEEDDEEEDDEVVVPDADLLSPEEAERRRMGLMRQRVIKRLPGVLTELASIIKTHSGLVVQILVAGPEPCEGGEMVLLNCGAGKTIGTNLTFAQEYLQFTLNVVGPFARFARRCIPNDEWHRYVVEAPNTPDALEPLVLSPEAYTERLVVPASERAVSSTTSSRRQSLPSSSSAGSVVTSTSSSLSITPPPDQFSESPPTTSPSRASATSSESVARPRQRTAAHRKSGARVSSLTKASKGSRTTLNDLEMSSDSEKEDDDDLDSPEALDITDQIMPLPFSPQIPSRTIGDGASFGIFDAFQQNGNVLADGRVATSYEQDREATIPSQPAFFVPDVNFGEFGMASVGGSSARELPGLLDGVEMFAFSDLGIQGSRGRNDEEERYVSSLSTLPSASSLPTTSTSDPRPRIFADPSTFAPANSSTFDRTSGVTTDWLGQPLTSSASASSAVPPSSSTTLSALPTSSSTTAPRQHIYGDPSAFAPANSSTLGQTSGVATDWLDPLLSSSASASSTVPPSSSTALSSLPTQNFASCATGSTLPTTSAALAVDNRASGASPANRLEAPTSSASLDEIRLDELPEWMHSLFEYLMVKLRGKEEDILMLNWVRFETDLLVTSTFEGLETSGIPAQIAQWTTQTRRLSSPPSMAAGRSYGKALRAWYTALMPDWRKPTGKKAWPLSRSPPPGSSESWSAIRRSGQKGINLLLLGLAWWKACTIDGTTERDDYEATLEDVAWVFTQLLKARPGADVAGVEASAAGPRSRKRKATNSDHAPSKQARIHSGSAIPDGPTGSQGRASAGAEVRARATRRRRS